MTDLWNLTYKDSLTLRINNLEALIDIERKKLDVHLEEAYKKEDKEKKHDDDDLGAAFVVGMFVGAILVSLLYFVMSKL